MKVEDYNIKKKEKKKRMGVVHKNSEFKLLEKILYVMKFI